MIAGLLVAAIAVDLALLAVASRPSGYSRVIGPIHLRLHDPTTLLVFAALLTGALVAALWRSRARGWSLALAPVVVSMAGSLVTRGAVKMFPIGDIAVIELYVRSALAGRLLVGPYSRFGWHHPGPLLFYGLAPVYAAAGKTTASLAALNMAALALLLWAAARSLGPRMCWALLTAVLLYLWRIPELVASAWNPHIIVLPLLALLVSAAAATGGDVVQLPIIAALATFIVQADVALVPVVAVVSAAAVAGGWAAAWRTHRSAALRNTNLAAWLMVVLWLIPVAEELTHAPGNLTLLWRFFVGAHGTGQTWSAAAAAWSAMLSAPLVPGFALAHGGTFERTGVSVSFLLAGAELACLAAVFWRFRRRDGAISRLAFVSLVSSLVALWSATRIEGAIMDHEVFWISAIGTINIACTAASFAAWALARIPNFSAPRVRPGALAHGALMAAAMAICFVQLERARDGRLPVTATSSVVERLTGSVREYLEQRSAHKPLVRIGEDVWGLTAGVLLDTDRQRLPFAVEDAWMPMFPRSFAARGDEDAEVAFGNGDEHLGRMRVPGSVSIASFPPLYIDGLPYTER